MRPQFLAFFFLLVMGTWAHTQSPSNAIFTVLSNLKKGWETKNTELLRTCFIEASEWQLKAYTETFGLMDRCRIDMQFVDLSYNSQFARVTTDVSRTWDLVVGGQRFPQAAKKRVHYILKYAGGRWGLAGTIDESRVKTGLPLSPGNLDFASSLISNAPAGAQQNLALDNCLFVNTNQNTARWAPVAKAVLYAVSIADGDLTRNASAALIWKTENATSAWVALPRAAILSMAVGKVYYFHVFAYDGKQNPISGEIFKIKRTE